MESPRTRALVAIAFCLLGPAVHAQLATVETDELRLLYREPFQSYLAPHAGRCFLNAVAFEQRLLDWSPSEKVTVLLNDFSDAGNASASAVPRNTLFLETSPISGAFETVSGNERMNWLMNHELMHVASVDQANRRDRVFRRLFAGKVAPISDDPESILYYWLTTPRDAAPRWFHEGIAVFVETWMAGGQGRSQGAYDEMVFRSMVRDGARFYDPVGLVSQGTKIDFQVEVNAYLYGTRFVTWLARETSPEQVVAWISRPDGSAGYFSNRFREVFGRTLAEAWRDWIESERAFQEANLSRIRAFPVTEPRDIGAGALGSVSRVHVDAARGRVYVGFNRPGLVAHIGSIDLADGRVTPIEEIKDPVLFSVTSLAWDPGSRTIFYTTDNREFRDLRALDPDTGVSRTLLKDARIGDLAFDPRSGALWGIRHFNGIATLVRIPPPYSEWFQVVSWPYGTVLYDLDASPDGSRIAAGVGGIDGLHREQVWRVADLERGATDPEATFDFGTFMPLGFAFTPDGGALIGSSYYTGAANVFRFDLSTHALVALSNAETGLFRPVVLPDGSLFVFRYTGAGFVPATYTPTVVDDVNPIVFLGERLIEEHPSLRAWNIGSPAKVDLEPRIVERGTYSFSGGVGLESAYPILEGYRDSAAAGARLNFSDPLSINRLSLNASYSPDEDLEESERLHLRMQYRRYDWTLEAKYNAADFYDLFGPTKTSRKGYSVRLGWETALVYDRPRRLTLSAEGSVHRNLEVLPFYQNVAAPSDHLSFGLLRLRYENLRSSLGHVDDEKGHRWQFLAGGDYARGTTGTGDRLYPQLLGGYDVGGQLPAPHASVWLRAAAGVSLGRNREDPYANFYFGGFGNNWVDHREVRRYREFYAFPGAEINEVQARTFAKSTLEWNLPPLRFDRLGTTGFYGSWLSASVFTGGLVTDPDGASVRRWLGDAGVQVDLRFTALSRLDMTLSVGWAVAVEDGARPRREAMLSLKVMP